jgi:prephenate dehydratase
MSLAGPDTSTQVTPRVAFQGERGAFSEDAVVMLWPDARPLPCRTVFDVTRAVLDGEADAGVLPVENTIFGNVDAALSAIASATELHVVGETTLNIRQCLLASADATLEHIEVVESHPVALAQCGRFLSLLSNARVKAVDDTAGAARAVAESRDPRRAAVASARAAGIYDLVILADHIEDRSDNQTRFLAIARKPQATS